MNVLKCCICNYVQVNCLMTISKPRTRDSDIIFKAKGLLELLAMNIPVSRVRVADTLLLFIVCNLPISNSICSNDLSSC